jgi:peroxiredoxin
MKTRSPAGSTLVLILCCIWVLGASPKAGPENRSTPDADLADWLRSLDARLAAASNPARWAADARFALWEFGRRVQNAHLQPAQEDRVVLHLDAIERAHPDASSMIRRARYMISHLSVGKTSPDIVGRDLGGAELKLSDYRGKVVVLVFSGDWCGICRSDYPYERRLLELYANWPFAMLGVDSSSTAEIARDAKARERLTFPAWLDAGGSSPTTGPIASAWNVVGWPAIYVLDKSGVIRFVDVQKEDLLKAVRELLDEKTPGLKTRGPSNHRADVRQRSETMMMVLAVSLGRSFSGTVCPGGGTGAIFASADPETVTS